MLHTSKFQAVCLLAALAIALSSKSVTAQSTPPSTVGEALRDLSSRAGLAFAGRVVSIERKGGVVEIEFSVDQPLLGSVSSSYILREWSGLWPPGQHRYVVGQRVLIFLHSASTAGLSTPVDGMYGIVPVVGADSTGSPLLDIRRISAKLQRAPSQSLPSGSMGTVSLADAAQIVTHWRQPQHREPVLRPFPQPIAPISVPQPLPSPTPILMPLQSAGAPNALP